MRVQILCMMETRGGYVQDTTSEIDDMLYIWECVRLCSTTSSCLMDSIAVVLICIPLLEEEKEDIE